MALFKHARYEGLHTVGDAEQVHPDHALPILDRRLFDVTALADASVVVQDVDAPAIIEDGLGQRLNLFRPTHVNHVIDCTATDFAGRGGSCGAVDICDVNFGAVPGEQPRGRTPYPRSGAGHDRGLSGQVDVLCHGDLL